MAARKSDGNCLPMSEAIFVNPSDNLARHASFAKFASNSLKILDSVYLRSSQNSQPNSDTPDVNSRKER